MAVMTFKPIYTVPEVASILQVNRNTVYNLMNKGELPYLVLGSRKVKGVDLERFINTYPTEGGESE